jgi:hypothetical protein
VIQLLDFVNIVSYFQKVQSFARGFRFLILWIYPATFRKCTPLQGKSGFWFCEYILLLSESALLCKGNPDYDFVNIFCYFQKVHSFARGIRIMILWIYSATFRKCTPLQGESGFWFCEYILLLSESALLCKGNPDSDFVNIFCYFQKVHSFARWLEFWIWWIFLAILEWATILADSKYIDIFHKVHSFKMYYKAICKISRSLIFYYPYKAL